MKNSFSFTNYREGEREIELHEREISKFETSIYSISDEIVYRQCIGHQNSHDMKHAKVKPKKARKQDPYMKQGTKPYLITITTTRYRKFS